MDWFTFSIVIACLLVSAFFSASETALTGGVARQHAAAVEAGQSRRRRRLQPVCDARADDRRAAARQQHRQYRRLGAGDRHLHGVVRRGRRALRHRRDDGDGRDLRRGAAEDHRHQRAGPGVAAGRAPDEADGLPAGTAAHRDRGDRPRADAGAGHQDRSQPADPVADRAVARRGRSAASRRQGRKAGPRHVRRAIGPARASGLRRDGSSHRNGDDQCRPAAGRTGARGAGHRIHADSAVAREA